MSRSYEIFRDLRKELGLTQVQWAKELGVSTVLIGLIEIGSKPISLKMLKKIYCLGHTTEAADIFDAMMEENE